MLQKPKNLKLK